MGMKIGVIGGGAAGFFSAIRAAECSPVAEVELLEKSNKVLGKVKVSGGGRCNVTHHAAYASDLLPHYPRGKNFLKKVFGKFKATDTVAWFEERGVTLKVEEDGRMFPITDDSQTVVDCLEQEARKFGVKVRLGAGVVGLSVQDDGSFRVALQKGTEKVFDRLVVCTGGYPKEDSYHWLMETGHTLVPPVPSLFTFNIPKSPLKGLEGVAVSRAEVRVEGTKLQYDGPLLVTHWGISGPAVLKTSAWGARILAEANYAATVQVRWTPGLSEEEVRSHMEAYGQEHPKRLVGKYPMFDLPKRLWQRLVVVAGVGDETPWGEVGKKGRNKLVEWLWRAPLAVVGKTTFKEEFVTAGGIALEEVNPQTLESRKVPGLFFAGEVLDIDGVTGGYNFQSAWSTGWVAGTQAAV